MASVAVYDVVHDRLGENWTDTPLVYEGEDWPTDGQPFVFVEIFGDFYDQASIGAGSPTANRWREGGQLLLNVMTRMGEGSRKSRIFAKALIDLFRGFENDGVLFRDASIGAGEPGASDGNYFRMTATINWQRDED